MTAENTDEPVILSLKRPGRRLSLAEVDAQQDEILRRLDELNTDILQLLNDFRETLGKDKLAA